MKNDPDVVRWSQIKSFLIRFLGWMFVYALFGWLGDFTRYSDQSNMTHFIILVALSLFMAAVVKKE